MVRRVLALLATHDIVAKSIPWVHLPHLLVGAVLVVLPLLGWPVAHRLGRQNASRVVDLELQVIEVVGRLNSRVTCGGHDLLKVVGLGMSLFI